MEIDKNVELSTHDVMRDLANAKLYNTWREANLYKKKIREIKIHTFF